MADNGRLCRLNQSALDPFVDGMEKKYLQLKGTTRGSTRLKFQRALLEATSYMRSPSNRLQPIFFSTSPRLFASHPPSLLNAP
eukprot:gene13085-3613_t